MVLMFVATCAWYLLLSSVGSVPHPLPSNLGLQAALPPHNTVRPNKASAKTEGPPLRDMPPKTGPSILLTL